MMKLRTLGRRIGPHRLILLCLAAPLLACTSPEQRFAEDCRSRGLQNGTDAMAQCIQAERQAAEKTAAQSPAGSTYIPPSFKGTGPGCYNC